MLWRNNSTGDTGYSDVHNSVFHSLGGSPTAYSVVGDGDFNGDEFADVLWRNNPTGDTGYSDNHNGAFHSMGGSPTSYSVVGVGDFNGDNFTTSCGETTRPATPVTPIPQRRLPLHRRLIDIL